MLSSVNIYLFKVNNRKTKKSCETCSKLTIKAPYVSQHFLVFLLLLLTSKASLKTDMECVQS